MCLVCTEDQADIQGFGHAPGVVGEQQQSLGGLGHLLQAWLHSLRSVLRTSRGRQSRMTMVVFFCVWDTL